MSLPAKSPMRNGPIAKPNLRPPCPTAGSRLHPARSRPDGCMLDHAVADESIAQPETTEVFLIFLPNASPWPHVLASLGAAHHFQQLMTLAGLKKCMPTTSGGLGERTILSTSRVEVLEAGSRRAS